jgi:hypothetical protein
MMVGMAHRLAKGPIEDATAVLEAYQSLLVNSAYSQASGRSTADEKFVSLRLKLATEAYSKLP